MPEIDVFFIGFSSGLLGGLVAVATMRYSWKSLLKQYTESKTIFRDGIRILDLIDDVDELKMKMDIVDEKLYGKSK